MADCAYEVIFANSETTRLGVLSNASYYWFSTHAREIPFRVMGTYCITLILEGSGTYFDARGLRYQLAPGDLITLFPDVGVRFAPPMGSTWFEIYVTFKGPIFDCLRRQGLLDPSRPILKLGSPAPWRAKLEAVLAAPQLTDADRTVQIGAFVGLLIEMLTSGESAGAGAEPADWLGRACNALRHDLGETVNMQILAKELGMSHETFRKRFRDLCGKSPNQYRTHWRLEAAKSLLLESKINCREIAAAVGYASEYHFSRKFRALTGTSPRQYRRASQERLRR